MMLVSPKYRPDIDGLRALAVLAVVGFHFFPGRFFSGFMGVDIFFVISGFLITNIIIGNLKNQEFSYIEFYTRRIKRIFPALILVMLTTTLFGWYVLFPSEYEQLGRHLAGGAGFVSNLILWNESGYFDGDAVTKPLHHLWSLGVEEQFYVFWPLLLGLAYRRRVNLLSVIFVVSSLSFIVNIMSVTANSTAAFYSPLSRFFEIMFGCTLAYINSYKPKYLSKYRNAQTMIGFICLTIGFCWINDSRAFPGWWSLLPCLGTFLILSAGPEAFFNRHVLSNRIAVWFGLISYPLYLWHWPIWSYANILGLELSHSQRLGLIMLSIVLAYLTYEYLEKTVKQTQRPLLLGSMSCLLAFGIAVNFGKLYPRQHSKSLTDLASAFSDWEFPGNLKKKYLQGEELFEAGTEGPSILFMGDSHMQQYVPRITASLKNHPQIKKAIFYGVYGGIPEIIKSDRVRAGYQGQSDFINRLLLDKEIKSVVLINYWNRYVNQQALRRDSVYFESTSGKAYLSEQNIDTPLKMLEQFVLSLSKSKKVFLVIDNPDSNECDPKNFFSGGRLSKIELLSPANSTFSYNPKQNELRKQMIALAQKTGATIIDPISSLCSNNNCLNTLNNGSAIYRDSNHLRASFVREHANFIDVVFNPETEILSKTLHSELNQ